MKSIFVSAGHSDTDPGAAGNGYTEANIVMELRNIVSFYLHRAGGLRVIEPESTPCSTPARCR